MVKLKLTRIGRTHQPHYRIVAVEENDKVGAGKYIEKLGHYIPTSTPKVLELDMVKYNAWIKKGAVPTPTVASLARKTNEKSS